jgi:hypothetical protein
MSFYFLNFFFVKFYKNKPKYKKNPIFFKEKNNKIKKTTKRIFKEYFFQNIKRERISNQTLKFL